MSSEYIKKIMNSCKYAYDHEESYVMFNDTYAYIYSELQRVNNSILDDIFEEDDEIFQIYNKYIERMDYYTTLERNKNEYLYDLLNEYANLQRQQGLPAIRAFIAKLIMIIGNIILFNTINMINVIEYENANDFVF